MKKETSSVRTLSMWELTYASKTLSQISDKSCFLLRNDLIIILYNILIFNKLKKYKKNIFINNIQILINYNFLELAFLFLVV